MTANNYIVEVKELVGGEIYIELPEEMLRHLDCSEGDTLVWCFDDDDRLILRKRNNDH